MEMCQKKSSLFFGPGWMLNSVCELCAQAEWPWLVKVSAPMVRRYMGYKGHCWPVPSHYGTDQWESGGDCPESRYLLIMVLDTAAHHVTCSNIVMSGIITRKLDTFLFLNGPMILLGCNLSVMQYCNKGVNGIQEDNKT